MRTGHWVLIGFAAAALLGMLLSGCAPEPYASASRPRFPEPAAREPLRTEPGDFWRAR